MQFTLRLRRYDPESGQAPYWEDHAIELKPDTEPPFMRIYNISPAELKALDDYINEALYNG